MPGKEVKIEEMRIRVPGAFEKDAQSIGQDAMQQVARSLPPSYQNKRLDAINLKVNISQGASGTEMTKLIAEAILRGLV
jgi:hypothetical protein